MTPSSHQIPPETFPAAVSAPGPLRAADRTLSGQSPYMPSESPAGRAAESY